MGADAYHALTDVAWRQLLSPVHARQLAPLIESGWLKRYGDRFTVSLPGSIRDGMADAARSARVAIVAGVDPARADAYARELEARARVLGDVEVDLDADAEPLLVACFGDDAPYAQAPALRWDKRAVPLDERAPADVVDALRTRTLPLALEPLGADALALLHSERLPDCLPPSVAGIHAIDMLAASFGLDRIGRRVMFDADVERHLVPALGAYLGQVMVRELGGEWAVPREADIAPDPNVVADWPISRLDPSLVDRIAVIVGDVAWLPFARARALVHAATRQGFNPRVEPILERSLTKMIRAAARVRGTRLAT